MWVKMRYVIEKANKDGTSRWYWQRLGFGTKRLPDDGAERLTVATALNERADAERAGEPGSLSEPVFGTIKWAVLQYRQSPKFARLAPGSRQHYERWMLSLSQTVGDRSITALTPMAVYDILKGIGSKGGKRHCATVLKRIIDLALWRGLVDRNPMIGLGLEGSLRCEEVWCPADIDHFLAACEGERHAKAVALGFKIMLFTAQRPGDMRRMSWAQYDGDTIKVRQQKTGKLVEVPCVAELRQALDEAKAATKGTVIVAGRDGRRLSGAAWRKAFNLIRTKADLDELQARDLRRTAIVNLARAGATVPEIAAISGHTIDRTQRILEVYLPRDSHMARAAIIKLETKR